MAKRKKTRSRRRARGGGDGNSCCPIIRIKCRRKYSAASGGGETLQQRLAKFKKAEWKANMQLGGLGNHNAASRCTVTVGRKTYKNLTGAAAAAKVAAAVKAQKAKRCNPLVVSGKR